MVSRRKAWSGFLGVLCREVVASLEALQGALRGLVDAKLVVEVEDPQHGPLAWMVAVMSGGVSPGGGVSIRVQASREILMYLSLGEFGEEAFISAVEAALEGNDES